jgi:hypothetical protein
MADCFIKAYRRQNLAVNRKFPLAHSHFYPVIGRIHSFQAFPGPGLRYDHLILFCPGRKGDARIGIAVKIFVFKFGLRIFASEMRYPQFTGGISFLDK